MIFLPLLALWLSSAPSSLAASNPALRRYPYLTDVVGSYATINWGTDRSQTSGAVRYGKAGSESCTAHYAPATKTAISVNGSLQYQWKAQLELLPGTQYCYRVYLGSGPSTEIDLLGSDSSPSFWTQMPMGATESFSFAVFGDWGYVNSSGTNSYQANVMSRIASSGARFAVTTGDNGYPSGSQKNYGDLVQTGADTSAVFGPSFWAVPGRSMPIFLSMGNHGLTSSDTNHPALLTWPQDRAVALSGGRHTKDVYCCLNGTNSASYPSIWYAFDAGPARFYVLNTAWAESNSGTADPYKNDYDYHWAPGTPQWEWLKADLAAHSSVLKFAFFHYPLYSDNPNEAASPYLLGSTGLEGLLKQHSVDIAFTGHAHIYERNLPSASGVYNYITGGGGATLGTLGTCTALDAYAIKFTTTGKACGSAPVPTSADQVYHFLKVTVNGSNVTVTPINSLGQSFDVRSYSFPTGSETSAPTVPANVNATPVNGTQVNLSWSASSDNTGVRGYGVYRNGTLIATLDKNTLSYSDTGLTPSTSYSYRVDAFDGSANHSAQSTARSVTTQSTATYTFPSIADAYVAADFATTNYGLSGTLKADASPDYRSYLRFNVNDIAGNVMNATLRLYTTSSASIGIQVQRVAAQNWEESSLTYANAPAVGPVIGSSGSFSAGNWVSVDVTSLVNGNGVYDLAITTTNPNVMNFNSRDASSNLPELIVQTSTGTVPTPTVTQTSPAGTPTATSSPVPDTGNIFTFTTVADARVAESSPTTNYGTATNLQADGDAGIAQTSFIRFAASGITGSIRRATLRVYCTTNGTANGPAVYLANSSWTESGSGGVTWNTQPGLLSGIADNKGAFGTDTWVEYDVTSLVSGNGTYTFALVADGNDGVTFSSREGTAPPELVVETLGTVTGTPTFTPVVTPTATATRTVTATASPTPTPTMNPSNTPTATGTATPSRTPTILSTTTPTATQTATPTRTITSTATSSPVSTFTGTATVTPIVTASPTITSTPTPTATQTAGVTATSTATAPTNVGSTFTFTTVADARVVQASPTTNYGTATTLQVDGDTVETSYIRFNASGMSGSIQNVKLRILCTTNGTANGPVVYLANSNWIESGTGGITWNTQPALISAAGDNKGAIATNSWVEYDVTAFVTGNGTYTFALVADGNDGVTFSSREGTAAPQLVVVTQSGPVATSTSTPTSTVTPANTSTATATPTNSATASSTPTSTPTATATPSRTQTATPTNTFTATATASPSQTPTRTSTATHTPTSTVTATPSQTATLTPVNTSTRTPTASATQSPTGTSTFTPLPTFTDTPTATGTATATPSRTQTVTPTNTFTATATHTPTSTVTATPSQTATLTPVNTSTRTPTASATQSPTGTSTFTPLPTFTDTPTATGTATATPSRTQTATEEPTATATPSPTQTVTEEPTDIPTASSTPSRTQTATEEPTVTTTPSQTQTATEEPTATTTPSPTQTVTEEPTVTTTPSQTQTATEEPTATTTPSPTQTVTEEPTVTTTPSQTQTATEEPTAITTPSPTQTVTEEPTVTTTPSQTQTATEEPTATTTPSPTQTVTEEPTVTATLSRTPTATEEPTATRTPSRTPTATEEPTDIPTASSTPSRTQTATEEPTVTTTPSQTQTATEEPTATTTPSPTQTVTEEPTVTATSSRTPTATEESTVTATPSRTRTPSQTPTDVPTDTATSRPDNTPTRTPTVTHTLTPTITPPPLADPIFEDGFESGDLSAWSSSVTDFGSLSVTPAAALDGSFGLQAEINDNNSIYVIDDTPEAETSYRTRFYFDPNSISMADKDAFYVLNGYNSSLTEVLRVEFRLFKGVYQLRTSARSDSNSWTTSDWIDLIDVPHVIELSWRASTTAGANNGSLILWVDEVQVANLARIDNDTRRIDQIRLGAVAEIDIGTRGILYFDAFASTRQSYIGPVPTPTP